MKINSRVVIVRESIAKIVHMLSLKKIRVTQEGTKAYVEHNPKTHALNRVNIPYLPDDAGDELIAATQGFLDHEVGHLLFSDFKVLGEVGLKRNPSFGILVNIIEDTFVERKMRERFTGSGANLSAVLGFLITKYLRPGLAKNPVDKHEEILLMPMLRAMAGQQLFKDFIASDGALMAPVMAKLGPDFPKLLESIESTSDTVRIADEFLKRLQQKGTPSAGPGKPGDKGEESKKGDKSKKGKGKSKPEKSPDASAGEGDQDEKENQGAGKEGEEESEPKDDKAGSAPAKDDKGSDEPSDDAPDEPKDSGEEASASPDSGEDEGQGESDEGESPDAGGDPGPDDDAAGDEPEGDSTPSPGDEAPSGEADEKGGAAGKGTKSNEGEPSKVKKDHQELEADNPVGEQSEQDSHHTEQSDGAPGDADNGIAVERDTAAQKMLEAMTKIKKDFDELVSDAIAKDAVKALKGSDYKVWSTDYDVIEPLEVDPRMRASAQFQQLLKEMIEAVDHMVGPMQKDLERAVAARSAAVMTAGHRSGRLHGPSLSRILSDRSDVFARKQENRTRNVAVMLVIDGSGSMMDKIATASYGAYALSSVLDRLNIPNEVVAFTTQALPHDAAERLGEDLKALGGSTYARHSAIYMPIIKHFHERMTSEVRERFTTLGHFFSRGLRSNVDGESVQLAHRRLMRHPAARRVMIVLSDGRPADHGDMKALHEHLKAVVHDIQRSGTDVVGIGIEDDSVEQYYPKSVVMQEVSQLPGMVMSRLKALLVPNY